MFPRNSRYAAKLFHTSKTRWVWICLDVQVVQVAVLMLRARHIYLVRPTPEENQLYGTTTGYLQQGIKTGRCCVEAECEGRSYVKKILNMYNCMVKILVGPLGPDHMPVIRKHHLELILKFTNSFFLFRMFSFTSFRRHLQGKAFIECSDKIRLIHFVIKKKHRPLHRHVLGGSMGCSDSRVQESCFRRFHKKCQNAEGLGLHPLTSDVEWGLHWPFGTLHWQNSVFLSSFVLDAYLHVSTHAKNHCRWWTIQRCNMTIHTIVTIIHFTITLPKCSIGRASPFCSPALE